MAKKKIIKAGAKKTTIPKKNSKVSKSKGNLKNWWEDKKLLIQIIAILILVFAAFFPMLSNDFTNWDDIAYVTKNSLLKDLSFSGISDIFQSNVVANYHPITILSLALNYQISELSPFSYLFTNLFLHILNTFLVFLFIYKLTNGKKSIALIVSLFFGIHPMHVESVAWISERKDVLYTFFMLLSFIVYLKYLNKPNLKKYLGVSILIVLSLLSKPAAVVIPVLLLLIDYFKERKFSKMLILEKLPFFILALIVGIVTIQFQSEKAMEVMDSFNVFERFLFSCYGSVVYILKLFIPWSLSALHPFPEPGSLSVFYNLAPLILLLILGSAYYFRKNRYIVFGLAFFLISIAPVLQFVTIGNAIIAERYTYVPYIGLLFILAYFFYRLEQNQSMLKGGLNMASLAVAVFIFSFVFLTFNQTKTWKNSESLWTNTINYYPESYRALGYRANHYSAQKQYSLALTDFNRSLSLKPENAEPLAGRGKAYVFLKQYPQALSDFNKAIELDPNNIKTLNDRGTFYFNIQRDYRKAFDDFNRAIEINPNYSTAYLNRSRCYFVLKDIMNARLDAQRAQDLGELVSADYLAQLR